MVQPVTCTACSNDALQLICLHPDNFIYPFITVGYKKRIRTLIRLSQFKDDNLLYRGKKSQYTLKEGNPINYIFPSEENNSDSYLPPEVQTFSAQLHGPGKK